MANKEFFNSFRFPFYALTRSNDNKYSKGQNTPLPESLELGIKMADLNCVVDRFFVFILHKFTSI